MAKVAAYKDDAVKVKLLWALRSGESLKDAAATINKPLGTVEGWIRNDDDLAQEVEQAKQAGLVALSDKPRADVAKPNADRWRRAHEQAAMLAPGFLGYVLYVDNLVSSEDGSHKLSPWVVFSLGEFYGSGKHEYWLRAGRGFSKSTSFTKVSLAESVFAESDTPPGEAFIYSVLSLDLTESGYKVPWFKRGLSKLPYQADEIEVYEPKVGRAFFKFTDCHGKRVEVRCFPPTIKAMSGPTLRGGLNDELAKWVENRSDDESQQTNSATQVLSYSSPLKAVKPLPAKQAKVVLTSLLLLASVSKTPLLPTFLETASASSLTALVRGSPSNNQVLGHHSRKET